MRAEVRELKQKYKEIMKPIIYWTYKIVKKSKCFQKIVLSMTVIRF